MAMAIDVQITDNSKAILEASKEQIYAWLEAIGEDAASTAAEQAPADTGRLRNSISSAVVEEEQAVYIGTNVEYAIYHEFGTGKYAEEGGRQTPWAFKGEDGEWHYTHGVPARHYLQFGITAHQAQYKALLEQYLGK